MHPCGLTGDILNPANCSFRGEGNVCRNRDNLTGICSQHACPIFYTQYASVREDDGAILLYLRQAARNTTTPGYHWEQVSLSHDPREALCQLEEHLLMQSWWMQKKCMEDYFKIAKRLMRTDQLKEQSNAWTGKFSVYEMENYVPIMSLHAEGDDSNLPSTSSGKRKVKMEFEAEGGPAKMRKHLE
ncbi:protein MAK16 homolog [Anopheles stephensi]|uniref:protein MAK16 homolog n=1 Tax=Anopheles stephensi TaxID=30069 RepID=UPI00165897BB|nr:protein MAK16 homolog [Anopheles stephensi]